MVTRKTRCVGKCAICGENVWLMWSDRIYGSVRHCDGCGGINREMVKVEWASKEEMGEKIKLVVSEVGSEDIDMVVVRRIVQKLIGKPCDWRMLEKVD